MLKMNKYKVFLDEELDEAVDNQNEIYKGGE